MAKYKVQIKKSAQKEILALPKTQKKKIIAAIQKLAVEPRGPNSKKQTAREQYRLRVGSYRILYEIHDDVLVIMIVKVAHRKGVYR